jgi:hypothetical protein
MINTFGAFLGMGIIALTAVILWHLADKDPKHHKNKSK